MNDTYNAEQAASAQQRYCKEKDYPHFAHRVCCSCKRCIYEKVDHGNRTTGISVEEAGSTLITGCPHCNRSYCD